MRAARPCRHWFRFGSPLGASVPSGGATWGKGRACASCAENLFMSWFSRVAVYLLLVVVIFRMPLGMHAHHCDQLLYIDQSTQQEALASFEVLASHCSWLDAKTAIHYEARQSGALSSSFKAMKINESLKTSTCHILTQGEERWRMVRFHGMKGFGDWDWHAGYLAVSATGTEDSSGTDRDIYITGSYSHPIDVQSIAFGNPPILVHHQHVWATKGKSLAPLYEFGGGSEQQCAPPGGMRCFLHWFPHGYGFPSGDLLAFDFQWIDVRSLPCEPLLFGGQFAVRYSLNRARLPSTVTLRSMGFSDGHGYRVFPNPDNYNILYYMGRWQCSGTLFRGHIHSHPTMPMDNFVLEGRVAFLPTTDTVLNRVQHDSLRARLMSTSQLRCIQIQKEGQLERTGNATTPRFRQTGCRPWKFKAGDELTVVTLTSPRTCCGHRNHHGFHVTVLGDELPHRDSESGVPTNSCSYAHIPTYSPGYLPYLDATQ